MMDSQKQKNTCKYKSNRIQHKTKKYKNMDDTQREKNTFRGYRYKSKKTKKASKRDLVWRRVSRKITQNEKFKVIRFPSSTNQLIVTPQPLYRLKSIFFCIFTIVLNRSSSWLKPYLAVFQVVTLLPGLLKHKTKLGTGPIVEFRVLVTVRIDSQEIFQQTCNRLDAKFYSNESVSQISMLLHHTVARFPHAKAAQYSPFSQFFFWLVVVNFFLKQGLLHTF